MASLLHACKDRTRPGQLTAPPMFQTVPPCIFIFCRALQPVWMQLR